MGKISDRSMTCRSIGHSATMPIGAAIKVQLITADVLPDVAAMLSFFWYAVLQGRNQLFETVKRGDADRLGALTCHKGQVAYRRDS